MSSRAEEYDQPGDGDGRHNVEDCPGTFVAMHNSVDEMNHGGASARVCVECGAHCRVEYMGDGPETEDDDG